MCKGKAKRKLQKPATDKPFTQGRVVMFLAASCYESKGRGKPRKNVLL